MSRKVIIPMSGGLDSSYLVARALAQGLFVIPVEFDDGNMEGNSEAEAARRVWKSLKQDTVGVNPNFPGTLWEMVSLRIPKLDQLAVQYEVTPAAHSQAAAMKEITYWSGYKALMYSVTLAYGGAVGADEIWFGVMAWNDHFVDELPHSAHAFQATWRNLYPDLKVPRFEFPLMGLTKAQVVRSAYDLQLTFALTWSCFDDEREDHCGICLGCQERKTAFKDAGVIDLTRYAA